ncbi:reverse transcriptase domain-containing protein [Tanacetum coccineum]
MLYDEFDKFTSEPNESIHSYYLRFAKLINDMNMIPMSMTPMQINTKFANHLQPKWSRFVIAAKQTRNLHSVTFDQLYAFLKHNEKDAKEVREMRQRFLEPLALLTNTYNPPPSYSSNQTQHQAQPSKVYQPYQYYQSSTPITQQLIQSPLLQSYAPPVVQQPPTFQHDTGLAIPTFLPTDDPKSSPNKAMIFLSSVYRSKFPPTNNQLRTSSNPRTQATIQNGQVTVQNVQGRQYQGYAGNAGNNQALGARVINVVRNTGGNQPRVIRCYNCNGEGHMAKQCIAKKRVTEINLVTKV